MFRAFWEDFRKSECGQDLSEYCLITAFIALAALGIFIHLSGGIQSIWGSAGTTLAATSASTPAPAGTAPTTTSAPAPSR